jgi:hypothetical protein
LKIALLHNLLSLPNYITVTKSSRPRLVGHVVRIHEIKIYTEYWSEDLKGRDNLIDLDVDDKIMLK